MNESSLKRPAGRAEDALRPVSIEPGAMKYAEGSVLVSAGETRVLVAASVDNRVPPFLNGTGKGWITAEYAMLPRATHTRSAREVSRGRPSGRSSEIQRLIGRSIRAAVDLSKMPDKTLTIDCDVIQADGGTRTASITGAYVATVLALGKLLLTGDLAEWPVRKQIAAISVGVVQGHPLLDLEYVEDQIADVDMNVVGTGDGSLIEVQGTAEGAAFDRPQLDRLLDLAQKGIAELVIRQNEVLAPVLAEVEAVGGRGDRPRAQAKDEASLWGRPKGV